MQDIELKDSRFIRENIFSSRWGLQKSGLLDLRSLIALNRTAKGNAYNLESWQILIENEIITSVEFKDLVDAKDFVKKIWNKQVLKNWLNRQHALPSDELTELAIAALPKALDYNSMLTKILQALPPNRLDTLVTSLSGGRELSQHELLRELIKLSHLDVIINTFSDTEKKTLLSYKDNKGNCLIHLASMFHNSIPLKRLIEFYPQTEWLAIVQTKNDNGETPLDLLVFKEEQFKQLVLMLIKQDKDFLLYYRGRHNNTLGHLIASSNYQPFLLSLLETYPEHERLIVLLTKKNSMGYRVLDSLGRDYELLKNSLPEHWNNPNFIQNYQGVNKNSFFHLLLNSSHPEAVLEHLEASNEAKQREILVLENAQQDSLLHLAAGLADTQLFTKLVSMLARDSRNLVMVKKNQAGNTVFHLLAKRNHIDYLLGLLDYCTPLQIKDILTGKNNEGDTVLHLLAEKGRIKQLLMLFNTYLPQDSHFIFDRNQAINDVNFGRASNSILLLASAKSDLASVKMLVSFLEKIPSIDAFSQLYLLFNDSIVGTKQTEKTFIEQAKSLINNHAQQDLAKRIRNLALKHLFMEVDRLTNQRAYNQAIGLLTNASRENIFTSDSAYFFANASKRIEAKIIDLNKLQKEIQLNNLRMRFNS